MSIKPSEFNSADINIIERNVLYQGVFRLVKYQLAIRKFAGDWSQPFSREILERKSAAAVIPYDPIQDKIVLIEQFRAGTLSHQAYPWLMEIVAGVLDQQESPEQVAIREAQEEAGCMIKAIEPICSYFVSPGGSDEYLTLFCGHVDADQANGIFGLDEEHEDIRAFAISRQEAIEWIAAGKILTSPAIIGIQWVAMNYLMLKEKWQKK